MATEQNGKRQVLDLSTLVERDIVKWDGREFEVLGLDEISLLDQQRLLALARKADESEGVAETQALVALVSELVVDIDSETVKSIPIAKLAAIVDFFFTRGEASPPPNREARRQTGAKSSRASKPRTPAARRTAG